ncbi:MAG: GIY-YIG nuclease family protein [bacterium]
MSDQTNRRELKAEYRESRPEAGVYRIVNTTTGRGFLASTSNLKSAQNRLEFARSTNSPGALDLRLKAAITEAGIASFEFEVLERLDVASDTPARKVAEDLATLEQLWREKLGPDALL